MLNCYCLSFNALKEYTLNDNCKSFEKHHLLFTSCGTDQFTCFDGSCIPEENRCDLVKHCYDNSGDSHLCCVTKYRDSLTLSCLINAMTRPTATHIGYIGSHLLTKIKQF